MLSKDQIVKLIMEEPLEHTALGTPSVLQQAGRIADKILAEANRETAWLVERADPNHPGHVLPDSFLGVRGSYDGTYGSGHFEWMTRAEDAVRFSRQKDAALFVGAIATMQENVIHCDTIRGLCSRDGPRAIVVGHMWTDSES